MPPFDAFLVRDLAPEFEDEAAGLAAAAGVHGLYVQNALPRDGHTLLLLGAERALGLLWFGERGNLVLLGDGDLDPALVAEAVFDSGQSWRIALGPAAWVDAVARRLSRRPLVHRDQLYYTVDPRRAAAERSPRVRLPTRADRARLGDALLLLNEQDLLIDADRVDRRWVDDTVRQRIEDGTSRVIGTAGAVQAKLDLGSRGPGGWMIEGVFTFAPWRGQGLATELVRHTIAEAHRLPSVTLHVDAANQPARAAYRRAGMHESGRCRLLLAR